MFTFKRIYLFAIMAIYATVVTNAKEFVVDELKYNVLIGENYCVEIISNDQKYSGDIVIPEKVEYEGIAYSVTHIDNSAFYNCSDLTSITIPNSVIFIGSSAFSGCTGLSTVNFNATNCTYMGESSSPVFNGCTNLKTVNIGENVKTIPDYTFYKCSGLTSVTIPNSVVYLSGFSDCTGLTSITIPNSVTTIGRSAFSGCTGLTSITIPNSVTTIGSSALSGCRGLTSITIPNLVTSIGGSAFSGCTGLSTVNFNATNCTTMGSSNSIVFGLCTNLKTINIGENVKTIPDYAFFECKGLTGINIPNSVTTLGMATFKGCFGLKNATIGNSVTEIGEEAFCDCAGLTSVTIGTSVTSIGGSAFNGCTNLTNITMPNSVAEIGSSAFSDCIGLTNITIPNSVISIYSFAFSGCSGLTSLTIGNSVTTIGNWSFFGCSGLTNINIPNSVTRIGETAFADCRNLTSVTIGNSVTTIGSSAFSGCSGLTSITIPNSVTSIGASAFFGCTSMTSFYGKFASSDNKCLIVNGNLVAFARKGITNYSIPSSVTSIDKEAFYYCSDLTSITIPNSIIKIGNRAFASCSGLTSITIPNSVTIIGSYAFNGCKGLTSVTIGNSLASIGDGAFMGCSALSSITTKSSTPIKLTESQNVFYEVNVSGCTLYVPVGSKIAYSKADVWGNFNIIELIPTESVILNKISLTLNVGNSETLSVTVLPEEATYKTVIWSSSDNNVAIVDANGRVTAVKIGTAVITATCGSISTTCNVMVKPIEVSRISIDNSELSLFVGNIAIINATIEPTTATDKTIKWASTNQNVASVDTNGMVTANSVGVASITATASNGVSATCKVEVNEDFAFEVVSITEKSCKVISDYKQHSGTVVIPEKAAIDYELYTVTEIGERAFHNNYDLTAIKLPSTIKGIGVEAFAQCTSLKSVDLPTNINKISGNAFNGCTGLMRTQTTKQTQTTATLKATVPGENHGIEGYYADIDGGRLGFDAEDLTVFLNNLKPNQSYNYSYGLKVGADYCLVGTSSFTTKDVSLHRNYSKQTSSSFVIRVEVDCGDAEMTDAYFTDYPEEQGHLTFRGLDPNTDYDFGYTVVASGEKMDRTITFSTIGLWMSTQAAQAMNTSTALLTAKTNTDDDEENVGFEWRRYDAPESMPSTKVVCVAVDGVITGALSGLNPDIYYKYRPYYTSDSGKTYYGSWVTFITGDAGVFFDPTVKTYEAENINDNSAMLKGYALRGSDDVEKQGFEFWGGSEGEVEVSGQKMKHTLTNLKAGTKYFYRTFIQTAKGRTYGEEQSFVTTDVGGIEDVFEKEGVTIEGYYNLQGYRLNGPTVGFNIIRYSDGTAKKVLIK